jgi:O-antigen/teichoic acid export membrane protein
MKIRQEFSIFFLQNSALAVNLATQFILTFILPLKIFGAFAKVFVVRDIVITMLSFSLGMSVIYNKTSNEDVLIATSFYLALLQSLIILLFGFFINVILSFTGYFNEDEFLVFLILIGSSFFGVFQNVSYSLYERGEKFIFNSMLSITVNIVVSGTVIFFAVIYRNIIPLLIREVLPALILTIIYLSLIIKSSGIAIFKSDNVKKDTVKDMVNYSLKMYFSRLSEVLLFRLDLLVVSRLFNTEVIGLYERTRYFATLPWATIVNYINRIHFVKYIKSYNKKFFNKTSYYAVLLNLSLFILLIVILFGLSKFTGEQIWQSILVLTPFFGGYAVGAVVENYKTFFYAKGEVIYAMITLRIFPIILFLLFAVISNYFFSINIYWIALLSSVSYISSLLAVKVYPNRNKKLKEILINR